MKYDIYLFEDCKVLKNKLGIKDEAQLDKAESEFASISMMELMDSGFSDFSPSGVCKIHKAISEASFLFSTKNSTTIRRYPSGGFEEDEFSDIMGP